MEHHSISLMFDKSQGHAAVFTSTWLLIFGEFEINEPGQFVVEVLANEKEVRVSHPDQQMLVRFAESFAERRHQTWSMSRQACAMAAYLHTFAGL